ncbi:MAG: hypothetical protein WAO58_08935 [Fimbriimonadaceae bacterium]
MSTMKLSRKEQVLVAITYTIFILAFFLPAYDGAFFTDPGKGIRISGWEAFREALGGGWYAVVSALTNFLVLTSLAAIFSANRRLAMVHLIAIPASFLFNLWWLLDSKDILDSGLSWGYFLWLASFALLTSVLWIRTTYPKPASSSSFP